MTPLNLNPNYEAKSLSETLMVESKYLEEAIVKTNDFLKELVDAFIDPVKPDPENNLNSVLELLCSFSQEQIVSLTVNLLRERVQETLAAAFAAEAFEKYTKPTPEDLHTMLLNSMPKGEA